MSAAQLKSMKKEIDRVLSDAKIMAFVQVVRRHEKATLGDVMALAKEMGLGHLNVGQILFDVLPRTGKDWSKKLKGLGPAGRAASSGMETRTAKGRKAYDDGMLETIKKQSGWSAAIDLREIVGGSPEQARRSINRLIECGRVQYTGKARATVYKAA